MTIARTRGTCPVSGARGATPAKPRGHFLRGHFAEFVRDRHQFMLDAHERSAKYGDVVQLRIGFKPLFLFNGEEHVRTVLVDRSDELLRLLPHKPARRFVGNGIFVSHGDTWKHQRARLLPLFSQSSVDLNAPVIVECATRMLSDWESGSIREMHREMVALALTIAGRIFCSSDIRQHAAPMHASLRAGADTFVDLLNRTVLPVWAPTPGNLRSRRAMRETDGLFYSMIERRRRHGGPDDDALGILMSGRDERNEPLSDRAVRDDLLSLLLGGHETTALAMAWVWHLLATHPEAQEETASEVATVLGGRPPEAGDRQRLPAIRRVLHEALRMYPPFWGLWREVVADNEVAGIHLRPGHFVMVSQWLAHRDPRYFTRPDGFCPARWGADGAGAPSGGAYFPFGLGPRTCIASKFAITEMTLIVATILQRYRVLPAPGHEIRMHPSFTLRPKNGIPLMLEARQTR